MLQRRTKHLVLPFVALVALTGAFVGGCSDGVPSGNPAKDQDPFDPDDIQAKVVKCASKDNPAATVKITANTEPSDRRYFVGVKFLDSDGNEVDTVSQKLTPQADSPDDEEITANVRFRLTTAADAIKVATCKLDHAF